MNKFKLILLSGLISIVASYLFISAIYIFLYGAIQISGIPNEYMGNTMDIITYVIFIIVWYLFYKILLNADNRKKSKASLK